MSAEPRYPFIDVCVSPEESELAASTLWDAGCTGIEEHDRTTLKAVLAPAEYELLSDNVLQLRAHFDDEGTARDVCDALPSAWQPRVGAIVGDDWRNAWKAFFRPFDVGARLRIQPSWEPRSEAGGRTELVIDPGLAFGTGAHSSTRLLLGLVSDVIRGGESVIDVGCGSGILGIAALLLGAERCVAIDIDELAIIATRENAERNGVSARIDARVAGLDGTYGTFDLVLANIEARVHLAIARELKRAVAPRGLLALSGILDTQAEDVANAFADFRLEQSLTDGEWVALVLRASA